MARFWPVGTIRMKEATLARTAVDHARSRYASVANLGFRQADCALLPFSDASFDAVLSTFGVMFTPNQDVAAAEMLRVCKSGGKVGLANWTPEGFIGQLFKTIGKHLPPPVGVKSPALWGTEQRLRELFDGQFDSITIEQRDFVFRYRSAAHWLEVFRGFYGPMVKAFAAKVEPGQDIALRDAINAANAVKDGQLDIRIDVTGAATEDEAVEVANRLGFPVVLGTSRKSFLGRLTGRPTEQLLPATLATQVLGLQRGASVFRVHDVAPTVLEAAGIPEPSTVHGVTQHPMEGVSMAYAFDDAAAPERHATQYFEMVGNRGIR